MKNFLRSPLFILFICCCAYILSMFSRACPAVLSLDLSRDLQLDNSQIGMLSGVTLLSYGFMQLPSGLLADRLGGRRSLCLLLLITAAGSAWFAFSTSLNEVLASRFMTGIGLAITVPCMVVLAGKFAPSAFGRASSIFLCCGGLGGILAAGPLAASSTFWGWRPSILAAALLTALLALCVWVCIREEQKPQAEAKDKAAHPSILADIMQILRTRSFWPLALWGMSIMGIYFAMISLWWGPYLMQGCALSKAEASAVLTLGALAAMIAQPVVGWLSDTVWHRRKAPIVLGTALGVGVGLLMVFRQSIGQLEAMLLIVAFILGTVATSSLLYTMLRESMPLHLMGTAGGLLSMFPSVWGVALQKIYGYLLDSATGSPVEAFQLASWVVLGSCAMGFAASLLMRETYGQEARG